MWLFALLVAVPIIEIALFIEVGGAIGLWPTLAVVVGTAFAGTMLLRLQGMGVLAELQGSLDRGGDPVTPIAHGAMILVAGVLLLTPGFFTDAFGFALLAPPVRAFLIRWGAARLAAGVRSGRVVMMSSGPGGPGGPARNPHPGGPHSGGGRPGPTGGDVIDGDWKHDEPAEEAAGEAAGGSEDAAPPSGPNPGGGSGWTRRP